MNFRITLYVAYANVICEVMFKTYEFVKCRLQTGVYTCASIKEGNSADPKS
jgi:hypothetical protein